jgi:hypothetical protein
VIVVCVILAIIVQSITKSYSYNVTSIISYNYKGIEDGLDPAGKNLDHNAVKSNIVLKDVIDRLKLDKNGLHIEDLKNNIEVAPVIPSNTVDKIKELESKKTLNVDEAQEFTYYPSKYIFTLKIPNGHGIDSEKAELIMNSIMNSYKKYFYYKYSDREIVENTIDKVQYSDYDYPEISSIINNQIELMVNFLTDKEKTKDGGNFRSENTKMSFKDITASLNVLKKVEVDKMDTIIGAFKLTKDKQKLIKLYEHRIKKLNLEKSKKQDESSITSNMTDKFKKERSITIIPKTTDENGKSNVNEKTEVISDSEYYDGLVDKSANANILARNNQHDSIFYKSEIERLNDDNIPEGQKKVAIKDVNELIKSIKKKLNNWTIISNKTLEDYYGETFYNKAITNNQLAIAVLPDNSLLVCGMAGMFIGCIFAVGITFFKEYRIEEKE